MVKRDKTTKNRPLSVTREEYEQNKEFLRIIPCPYTPKERVAVNLRFIPGDIVETFGRNLALVLKVEENGTVVTIKVKKQKGYPIYYTAKYFRRNDPAKLTIVDHLHHYKNINMDSLPFSFKETKQKPCSNKK